LSGGYDEKLSELFCAVLCTTLVDNDTHTREQLLFFACWFRFRCPYCVCL